MMDRKQRQFLARQANVRGAQRRETAARIAALSRLDTAKMSVPGRAVLVTQYGTVAQLSIGGEMRHVIVSVRA